VTAHDETILYFSSASLRGEAAKGK